MHADIDFRVDQDRLVSAPCVVCGATAPVPAYPVRDPVIDGRFRWSFVLCGECGHGYIDPRPDAELLDELYAKLFNDSTLDSTVWSQTNGFDQGLQRARVAAIQSAVGQRPVERILDVGCGIGMTLEKLAKAFPGAECMGTEASPVMTKMANEREGVHVTAEPFLQREVEPASLDVLSMNHLLEHLFHPRVDLERAAEWVKPGGVIHIEVPQLEGWARKTFGRWWWCHLPPQHLQLFSESGLRKLLKETGFPEVVSVERTGYPANITVAWALYIHMTFGKQGLFRNHGWIRIPICIAACLPIPLTLLADLLINRPMNRRNGDILRIVARRA